jgi:Cys-rich four helix bundle protein (predicted Tat secretion target)
MNRRAWLQSGAALSTLLASQLATAEDKSKKPSDAEMHHHHHHTSMRYGALAHAATHCVMVGEACMGHCLELLSQGDKSMGECAKSVEQMMSLCTALRQLATWNSVYVPALAKVALEACTACEQACRKHEKMHETCKACADSCATCAAECKKIAA